MVVGTKQGQWMARDLWLKGSNGVLGRAAWQVLRLRRSQSARTAALRMTNLGWVEENRQKQEQARIPFGNDKQERQEQEQEQEQQPIQWSIRCAQDDESWGGVGFVKNEQLQLPLPLPLQPQISFGNDKKECVVLLRGGFEDGGGVV